MKWVVFVVVATIVNAQGWGFEPRRKRQTTANANDYVDTVLAQVDSTLSKEEPIPLSDQYAVNFTVKDLFGIKWKTRLGLYDGSFSNASSLYRKENATLSYSSEQRALTFAAGVAFHLLEVDYHYVAQLINIGPKGLFVVKVKELQASMNVTVNLRSFNATLNSFKLRKAKSIKVDVKGLGFLANWATETFVNVFLAIFKGPILRVIEGIVRNAVQDALASVDASSLAAS